MRCDYGHKTLNDIKVFLKKDGINNAAFRLSFQEAVKIRKKVMAGHKRTPGALFVYRIFILRSRGLSLNDIAKRLKLSHPRSASRISKTIDLYLRIIQHPGNKRKIQSIVSTDFILA